MLGFGRMFFLTVGFKGMTDTHEVSRLMTTVLPSGIWSGVLST
jgi:hypothetical protein